MSEPDDPPIRRAEPQESDGPVPFREVALNPFRGRFHRQNTPWFAASLALLLIAWAFPVYPFLWRAAGGEGWGPLGQRGWMLTAAVAVFSTFGGLILLPRLFALAVLLPVRVAANVARTILPGDLPDRSGGWSGSPLAEAALLAGAACAVGLPFLLSPYASFNRQNSVVVAKDGTGDCDTIRGGVRRCRDGGVVLVKPGVFQEQVIVDRPMTIRGEAAPGGCVVVCEDHPALQIRLAESQACVIDNVLLRRVGPIEPPALGRRFWFVFNAAAVVSSGTPQFRGCIFESKDGVGLSVLNRQSSPVVSDCEVRPGTGYGVYFESYNGGTLRGCRIAGEYCGVKLLGPGTSPEIIDCTIEGTAKSRGFSFEAQAGGQVVDCSVRGCKVGLLAEGAGTTPIVENLRVEPVKEVVKRSKPEAPPDDATTGGAGIIVMDGAAGSYREVTVLGGIYGIVVDGAGSEPVFVGGVVDGCKFGVEVLDGAAGRYEALTVNAATNKAFSLAGDGTAPALLRCVAEGIGRGVGLFAEDGAGGTCEDCRFTGHTVGAVVRDEGTRTRLSGCSLTGNGEFGLAAAEASKKVLVENCDLRGNGSGPWYPENAGGITRSGNED